MSFALNLLHSSEGTQAETIQMNTHGLQILSPLMAARQQCTTARNDFDRTNTLLARDYSIFCNKECFAAFTKTLDKPGISDDALRIVLSILANLLATGCYVCEPILLI